MYEGSLWEFFKEAWGNYDWHTKEVIGAWGVIALIAIAADWLILAWLFPLVAFLVGIARCLYRAYKKLTYESEGIGIIRGY